MTILHSPTERARVVEAVAKAAAAANLDPALSVEVSSLAEPRGVDFLWRGYALIGDGDGEARVQGAWHGVQRKELNDLLASFDDGRLSKEIAQMAASVALPHLLIEGRVSADLNGELVTNSWGRGITISGLRKRLLTIASRGVHVSWTRDIRDTADAVVDAYLWSQQRDHATGRSRPKPRSDWGRPTNLDFQVHLLEGLPGVGVGTARKIIETLGRCPVRVDATVDELVAVPGVGKATAQKILSINGDGGDA